MMRRTVWLACLWLMLGAAVPLQLPVLAGMTVSGRPVVIDPARHEVVIVHFWATWCAPCRLEMPMLDKVGQKFGKDGLRIVGIALDAGASRKKIAAAGTGFSFPLVRLSDIDVPRRDVPGALPETLIYGRDGRLRYRFGAGGTMLDAATLDRIVPPLLAER